MKKILILLTSIGLSNFAHAQDTFADIVYGSKAVPGSAFFLGTDSAAADSLIIGYFSGSAANASGTGFVSLAESSSWNSNNVGFNAGTTSSTNVTAASSSEAWLKIVDGLNAGYLNLDSWDLISGAPAGNTPDSLDYTVVGTHDGAYTAFGLSIASGGFQGTGYDISVVPEPGTFALLFGFVAFIWVAIRRRK